MLESCGHSAGVTPWRQIPHAAPGIAGGEGGGSGGGGLGGSGGGDGGNGGDGGSRGGGGPGGDGWYCARLTLKQKLQSVTEKAAHNRPRSNSVRKSISALALLGCGNSAVPTWSQNADSEKSPWRGESAYKKFCIDVACCRAKDAYGWEQLMGGEGEGPP